jgi:hypothetical protein
MRLPCVLSPLLLSRRAGFASSGDARTVVAVLALGGAGSAAEAVAWHHRRPASCCAFACATRHARRRRGSGGRSMPSLPVTRKLLPRFGGILLARIARQPRTAARCRSRRARRRTQNQSFSRRALPARRCRVVPCFGGCTSVG